MRPMEIFNEILEGEHNAIEFDSFVLKIAASDRVAADMLLWLADREPALSMGEMVKALDNARWWAVLFASIEGEDE